MHFSYSHNALVFPSESIALRNHKLFKLQVNLADQHILLALCTNFLQLFLIAPQVTPLHVIALPARVNLSILGKE